MGRSKSRFAVRARAMAILALVLLVLASGGYVLHGYRKRTAVQRALTSGLAAFEAGRYAEAADDLRGYLGAEPRRTDVWLKYAEAQLKVRPQSDRTLQDAVYAFETILRLEPGYASAFEQLAQLYLMADAPMEAERVSRNRLAAAPQDVRAAAYLASALIAERKPDEAVAVLQPLVAAHPDEVRAAATLAFLLLTSRNDAVAAGKILDAVVEANPKSVPARVARIRLFLVTGQHDRVGAELEEAEKIDSRDAASIVDLGKLLSSLAMEARANAQFDKAEKLAPSDPGVYMARAQIDLDEGDFAAGAGVIDRALAAPLGQQRDDLLFTAVELYAGAGRLSNATRCIEELQSKKAPSESLIYLEALVAMAESRPYEAVASLQDVIRRNARHARAQLALGRAYAGLGRLTSAVQPLREYVRLDGKSIPARLRLARVLASLGQWAEAIDVAREANASAPNHLSPALARIELEGQVAKPGGSQPDPVVLARLYDQTQALAGRVPGDVRVCILLARLAAWRGQLQEAADIVTRARGSSPDARLALTAALAGIYSEARQYDKAIADLNAVLASADAASAGPLKLLLAELHAKAGELPAACEMMEKTTDGLSGSARASARLKLATWLRQQDKKDEARACLIRAIAENDNEVPARLALLAMGPGPGKPTPQDSVDQLKQIEGETSTDWKYWQARIWLESEERDRRRGQIESLLKDCLARNPEAVDAALLLGAMYEKADEFDQAISVYSRARAASPRQVDLNRRLLALMTRRERWSEVDQLLDSLPADDPVWYRYRIALALRRGNSAKATGMLEWRVAGDATDFLSRLQLAALLRRGSEQSRADALLAEAARIAPNAPEVLAAQVDAHLSRAEYQQALARCNEAMAQSPGPEVCQLRARVHEAGGQPLLAEKDLRTLAGMPGMAERAFLALGHLYLRQGNRDQAIEAWCGGLKAEPGSLALRSAIASAKVDSGDQEQHEAGMRMLQDLLAERPEDEGLLLLWADQLRVAEPVKAEGLYENILKKHATSLGALLRLVQMASAGGKRDRAMQLIEWALSADPRNVTLLLLKSDLLLADSPNRAALAARQAVAEEPGNEVALIALAKALAAAGDSPKAVETLESFLARQGSGKSSYVCLSLAQLHLAAGRPDQARAAIDEAARQEPDAPATAQARLYWYHAQKEWDALAALAGQYRKDHPNETGTPRLAAALLLESGQSGYLETARGLLEHVVRLRPDDAGSQGELGFACYRAGRVAKARAAFERGLKLAPEDVGLANALAWLLSEDEGDVRAAAAVASKPIQKGAEDPSLLDTWGVIQYRQGDFKSSRQVLERCLAHPRIRPSTRITASVHLARTLIMIDRNAGQQMLKRLLAEPTAEKALSQKDLKEARALLLQGDVCSQPAPKPEL